MKNKVYVIGTSNSVIRNGWIEGLKTNKDLEVVNLSRGGSPVFMHIATVMLKRNELENADLIILDHAVNDINCYMPALRDRYLSYIDDLMALVSTLNKPVINMIFPILTLKKKSYGAQIREYVGRLCKQYGYYLLDFNRYTLNQKYYMDDLHLRREVAFFLGMELTHLFSDIVKNDIPNQSKVKLEQCPYEVLDIQGLKQLNNSNKVKEFKNSLGSFPHIQLRENMRLSNYSGYSILGLAYFNEPGKTYAFQIGSNHETVARYRACGEKYMVEALPEPILIDGNTTIGKVQGSVKEIPCLLNYDESVRTDTASWINLSFLLLRDNSDLLIKSEGYSRRSRPVPTLERVNKIINTLPFLFDGMLTTEEVDTIRDAALIAEKQNINLALKVMNIAYRFRPKGVMIKRKINAYIEKMDKSKHKS